MIYRFDPFSLDTDSLELQRDEEVVAVEPQVFSLLAYLIENRDRVIGKDELIEAVWDGRAISDGALNSRINAARRAVGDTGSAQAVIKTFTRRGFRFIGSVTEGAEPNGGAKPPALQAGKPSIAVLPFDNMSGDPEQEYFSDGISEDIITALSRMRHLLVIARNTTFTYKGEAVDVPSVATALGVRYVLEGSVRKAGNRVRITAQLIDGKSGNQIWAERYDRELEDIFAVQDEITETVVRAIEPELSRAERERSRRIPPENLDAWAALQRGISCYYELQRDSYAEAINLFDKATQLDPTFALAFAWAATVRCRAAIIGFAKFDRESAYALAQRGINLDPQESMAHYSLGTCHYIARQPEFALGEFEEALRINPNNEQAMHQMARALTLLGRHAKAIDYLDTALKVSPRDPLTGVFLAAKSLAYLLLRDQQNAIECAKTAVRYPQPIYAPAFLLSALGHAGRTDETPAALLELRRVRPQFSISYLRENMTFPLNDADMSYFLEGLAKGGLD